ncbi:TetR/AcrR family transcriptional regulator [Demequina mangrovi]|uniref:Transcriptional regulator, TetR family n=1 Tax=Demequina mangrovi TaxID=1043493 RepID=A0A1H6WA47_9MICO|nr:TetR/AcrR family transcriptional regulator [Demequina mangrovi]SEJ09442.1 transcriptional regulator, TetR family [Demequina mangrovi]
MTGSAASASRGRGPRGGDADTRGDILAAAARIFGDKGYAASSLRAIARDAGVDPALVRHYFGTKQELFIEVMRPLERDDARVAALASLPPERRGDALLRLALSLWEDPVASVRLRAVLASAVSAAEVGPTMASMMLRDLLLQLVREDRALERAAACATQLTGLAFGRYVLAIPTLAEASVDELSAIYAPTLQRYLDGDLDAPLPGGEADVPR